MTFMAGRLIRNRNIARIDSGLSQPFTPDRLAKSDLVRNLHPLQSSGFCWWIVSPGSMVVGLLDECGVAVGMLA